MKLSSILAGSGLLAQTVLAFPVVKKSNVWKRATNSPKISVDFPDPTIVQAADGTWYAFGTSSNNKQIQVATASDPTKTWTYLDTDALPNPGGWTTGLNTWAPDVRILDDKTYVMYYSGQVSNSSLYHCTGAAISKTPQGPYTPMSQPFACDLTAGGSIDPYGFQDSDGTRYVAYKVDGNSIGHGGTCNNDVAPIVPTPILLQQVQADGITKVGDPVQILDRTDADGPLVEAPAILLHNGKYTLFFSSGCFTEESYNVNYAMADNVKGPYNRSTSPLVRTDDSFGLRAPGGATPLLDGSGVVFHADCSEGRCFFETEISMSGNKILLNGVDGIGSKVRTKSS